MICANKDGVFKLTIQGVNEYIKEDCSLLAVIDKYISCVVPYFMAVWFMMPNTKVRLHQILVELKVLPIAQKYSVIGLTSSTKLHDP